MTDRYALFGHPLGHSKSPLIHDAFARALGHDVGYSLIEAPPGGFAAAAQAFRDSGAKGCNITAPFKLDAFALATHRMQRAEHAGAANCLKFEPDGRILAEMFDGIGLANDIQRNLGVAMTGKRILVLGAGGAVRGAVAPLLACSPGKLVIANRTTAKAVELARRFSDRGRVEGCGYGDLANERFDLMARAPACAASCRPCRPRSSMARSWPTNWPTARGSRLSCGWPGMPACRDWPMASGCWSSRLPKPGCGGAAYARRQPM